MRSTSPASGLAVLLIAAATAAGQGGPKEPPAAYAGSEACGTCHEDLANAFARNPHHAVETDKRRGWEGKACEACHGAALKHTESTSPEEVRNPAKLTAAAADQLCLTCHRGQPTHAGRLESSHAKDQVACTSCHKVHANGPAGMVTRKPAAVNELCASCHTGVMAQFQKPFHHPVAEGAMTCVDCHNPHGSMRSPMAQSFAANEPGCFKCHGDKRGPFTFEHAPVRFESCATCHEPHGSVNPRMLTRPVVRQVCLECHANLPAAVANQKAAGVVPPAFHDLRSPRYQNCTVCHQKVHGSHVDRNLLR